ncbi:MAG: hypothetical protein UR15_C0033G0009 [Parcubacteria group bacterium GW2011_GWA2_31_28]|nr:MAG: hypothetical protein UR15_C0033G0009 [Parcubacteria group bacterium GW2011_GWA2_31_28]
MNANKNAKILPTIMVAILILIIIIGGVLFFRKVPRQVLPEETKLEKINFTLRGEGPFSVGASEEAIERALQACLDGSGYDTSYHISCKAVTLRDLALCRADKDCEDIVYFARALDKNEVKRCEDINKINFRNICLSIFNNNETYCENTPSEAEKEYCIRFIRNAISGLHNSENAEKACKGKLNQKSNELFCKSLLLGEKYSCDEALNVGCYTFYYSALGTLKKDTSYCDKIDANIDEVMHCKEQIS